MAAVTKTLVLSYALLTALPLVGKALHLPDRDLHGEVVEEEQRVPFTLRQLWTDATRSSWTRDFENTLGFRGIAIAVDNTALYYLFGETKQTSDVTVGNSDVLFPTADMRYDVWRREVVTDRALLEQLVEKIARVQDLLRKKHRALVPILIPPKTLIWWDSVPERMRLSASADLPPPATHRIVRAALESRGVEFVDMRTELRSMKVPREALWGRDARHWSSYAACLAVGRMLEKYGALTDRAPPPHRCRFDASPEARLEEDDDMGRALNVFFRPKAPVTPVAVFEAPPPGERPTVLIVSTSFGWGLARGIRGLGVSSDFLVDYYGNSFVSWPSFEKRPAVAGTDDWRRTVGSRDLIVLDLYETFLRHQPTYAMEFVDEYLRVFGEE